jgi:transcription elongation GreA/GreB family factor
MLSNFQYGDRALLQSFLVGQPELRTLMRSASMEQFRQRIIASYHLGPLDEQETRGYIEHRLHRVAWKGNPEFDEAKDELGFVDGEIRNLEDMLANAVLIQTEHADDGHAIVHIGSEVIVRNEDNEEECYRIVGKAEANPRQGMISNESHIGRALLDRRPGDEVAVAVPDGTIRLTIVRTT